MPQYKQHFARGIAPLHARHYELLSLCCLPPIFMAMVWCRGGTFKHRPRAAASLTRKRTFSCWAPGGLFHSGLKRCHSPCRG